jgi:hypothetical protein
MCEPLWGSIPMMNTSHLLRAGMGRPGGQT